MTICKITPACSNDQPLVWCRVGDSSVVMDECRVKGHTIHIECDRGKLHTKGQVMPLTVTHLSETEVKVQLSSKTRCTHPHVYLYDAKQYVSSCDRLVYLFQFPKEFDRSCGGHIRPIEERETTAMYR